MSKETLKLLHQHDDFIESIKHVVDMGAGDGTDALWWATLQSNDDEDPADLNIKVTAVDRGSAGVNRRTHKNIKWKNEDFTNTTIPTNSADLIWCYDSLQYSEDPIEALIHWHDLLKKDAMLCLTVPYNLMLRPFRDSSRIDSVYKPGAYFNFTPANLILLLASAGYDCREGHFKFVYGEPWIHAAVYKGTADPQAYMNWYELMENKMLPPSAEKAIKATGQLKDSDLVVEWIDHNVYALSM